MYRAVFKVVFVALSLSLAVSSLASASVVTEYFAYSGAQFGNNATATGYITIDTGYNFQPGLNAINMQGGAVTDLSMTITGATGGNGTFSTQFFTTWFFDMNSGLDLTKSFIGQTVTSGAWGPNYINGVNHSVGDFNFMNKFGAAPGPITPFVLATDGGAGDKMLLTALGPAAVPEPSTYILLTIALGAVGFARKKMSTEA